MNDFNPVIPTKKQKPFKGSNPATVAKVNAPNSVPIDPQAVPNKAYTKTQKKFTGGNKATVGKPTPASHYQAIDPSKTSPKAYTKTQKKA